MISLPSVSSWKHYPHYCYLFLKIENSIIRNVEYRRLILREHFKKLMREGYSVKFQKQIENGLAVQIT